MDLEFKDKYLKYKIKYLNLKKLMGGKVDLDRNKLMEGRKTKIQEAHMEKWVKSRKDLFTSIIKLVTEDIIYSAEMFLEYCKDSLKDKSKELDDKEKVIKSIDNNLTMVLEEIVEEDKKVFKTGKHLNELRSMKNNLNKAKNKQQKIYNEIKEYKFNLEKILNTINERGYIKTLWWNSFKFVISKILKKNINDKIEQANAEINLHEMLDTFNTVFLEPEGYKKIYLVDKNTNSNKIKEIFSGDPIKEKNLVDKYLTSPIL